MIASLLARDCQQRAFIMLNEFCPLSKKTHPYLFLTNNIKMDSIPNKIKWNIHALFLHYISSFEGTYTSYKICKIEPPDLLFMVVFISFYTVRQGKPSLRLHIIYLKDCLRCFSPHKLICMMSPNKCKV